MRLAITGNEAVATTRRSGGRPSKLQSGKIEEEILDIATGLFLAQGYGATSIEEVASECGISKRTFYHRFDHKKALFSAVAHRLIRRVRPESMPDLFKGKTLEAILLRLTQAILAAVLTPEALALHRIILAEATRFPELAIVMENEGSKADAISRIAGLLEEEKRKGAIEVDDTLFAAEQFLQMVIAVPQRRAMGLGVPMTSGELAQWALRTVDLFLHGCRENSHPAKDASGVG